MNQHLQTILITIQGDKNLSEEEKNAIIKSLKDADKEFEITNFKLDRTEKVKRTTAILLEETIEELEQKRKAVEAQNRELEIESALERVRTVAMAMRKADDLLGICKIVYDELQLLGFIELRNAMINIHNDDKSSLLNYDYSENIGKTVTNIPYKFHPLVEKQVMVTKNAQDAFFEFSFIGEELKQFRELRKKNGEQDDPKLEITDALHYYFYSIGTGSIGISTYSAINEEKLKLLKRFRNVFSLSYQRYTDIALAELQAREAQIQLALERVRARTMAMQKSDELGETAYVLFQQFEELGEDPEQIGIGILNEEEAVMELWSTINGKMRDRVVKVSLDEPVLMRKLYAAYKAEKKILVVDMSGKDLEDYNNYRNSIADVKIDISRTKDRRVVSMAYFSKGIISLATPEPRPAETMQLLEKFANVFDLTYTRFLDLKNAEAQTKESQIQLALERVRARTMAMQKSDELAETAVLLFHQLMSLGFELRGCGFNIWEKDEKTCTAWMSTPEGNLMPPFKLPLTEDPLFIRYYESRQNGEYFWVQEMRREELITRFKYLRSLPVLGELLSKSSKYDETEVPDFVVDHVVNFSNGNLIFITYKHYPDEWDIFKRFGKVFEQTYTRFLDLQKAEAQAKEAQIEAALEKVRSRSLAVHKSSELNEVVIVLFEKLQELDIPVTAASIDIFIEGSKDVDVHTCGQNEDGLFASHFRLPYFDHPIANDLFNARETGSDFFTNTYPFEEKNSFYEYQFEHSDLKYLPDDIKKLILQSQSYTISMALAKNSMIVINDFEGKLLSEKETDILKRFAKVFEQAYIRFLDLQKAEAQAREARIEAALERTRTQSMVMQHSRELDDTLRVFHEQVLLLGIPSAFSFLWLPDEKKERHMFWAAWAENTSPTQLVDRNSAIFKSKAINYPLDRNEPATAQCLVDWKGNESIVSYRVPPAGVENYFAAWQELIDGVEKLKPEYFSGGLFYVEAFMKYGCFGVMVESDLKEDEKKILGRFAIEFERTYRRFLDLQKAEAQAREAQIESALERVRSKAMSMQKSEDLAAAISIVFEELGKLDLGMLRCGIGILNKERRCADVWTTTISDNNTVVQVSGDESMDIHPLLSGAFDAWINQENHSYTLKGEDLINYYKAVAGENFKLPASQSLIAGPEEMTQYYYNAVWSSGGLFAFRETPFPEEAKTILKRFADVFTLTYTRFSDLKQAEAQAKEAKIEVALERVRSRTLAMQGSDELAETAAVLFRQLISLGIQPNRLYIAIVKDETGNTEFWITDEDGSKVSSAFETNLNDNPTFKKMFDGWKAEKKSLVIDMHGEELQEYFKYLSSIHVPFKGGLIQKRRLQDIAYFSKGFIGMASPDEQPAETLQLLERFAYTFNLTFTRFNDLKIAEAHAVQAEEDLIKLQTEKKRAEDALTELRATQTQLIQSEKMASLGELTAGIAHEIQNPLNFVNNFSEVSNELIDEMNAEIEKGDMEEAKAIANDIKQNLEKINHHGKRADAIVKGMLQHSRATSATKEPTDINKLADEYLRLAYHGLRAKDKSFNATLKTDYDESIGRINIIPQDIGRVILNLITNAFYAVAEKKKQNGNNYEPTVTVSTSCSPLLRRGVGGEVHITVADNGNGIPQKVLDKIFQPFFTTKPTGQGTGLGLSLSYDIVKAHGGEIKVETKQAEGTTFKIELPV